MGGWIVLATNKTRRNISADREFIRLSPSKQSQGRAPVLILVASQRFT